MTRKLIVEIVGDASALEKSYRSAEKATGKFGQQVERAGRGATVATVGVRGLGRAAAFASGAFLGGAGLAAGMKTSVEAASNLNEQISKTNQVFGASAAGVRDWSETTATAMGLAQDQALEVASSFGALFRPLGILGAQSAQQSEKLTQLGADLASFYNTSVQDALDAIRSGLVGESEPLRRYGVLLSETRVQQEALRETGKTSAKQLTDQEKVLARIALIYKDTGQAQGDFQRTSKGLANQTRILQANLRDLATTIGTGLTGALQKVAGPLNSVLTTVNSIKRGPPVEDSLVPDPLRVALVPKLARDFERLKAEGRSTGDAVKILRDRLGDSQKGAELLAEALRYTFSEDQRRKIAKIRIEVQGLGADAEAAAKAASGIALAAAAREAARPRGEAAIGPGGRLGLALQRARLTRTTTDDLKVLAQQRELYARQIRSLQNRLSRATGAKARDLADQLSNVLSEDEAAFAEINSIEDAAAAAAQERARKAQERAKKIAEAEKKRREALKRIAQENVKTATARIAAHNAAAQAQAKAAAALSRRQLAGQEARQFGLLGLGPTGEERIPIVETLQRRLRQLTGTSVDTGKVHALFANIRRILSGEFGRVSRDVRAQIDKMLDDIAGKLSDAGPLTKAGAVGGRKLALALSTGLHLSPAELARFERNVNAQKLTAVPPVHVHVEVDGREIGHVATKTQQRDRFRTARQTSGFRG